MSTTKGSASLPTLILFCQYPFIHQGEVRVKYLAPQHNDPCRSKVGSLDLESKAQTTGPPSLLNIPQIKKFIFPPEQWPNQTFRESDCQHNEPHYEESKINISHSLVTSLFRGSTECIKSLESRAPLVCREKWLKALTNELCHIQVIHSSYETRHIFSS